MIEGIMLSLFVHFKLQMSRVKVIRNKNAITSLPALVPCGFCMTLGLNGNGSLKEAHLPCLRFRPSNVLWTFRDLTRWEGGKALWSKQTRTDPKLVSSIVMPHLMLWHPTLNMWDIQSVAPGGGIRALVCVLSYFSSAQGSWAEASCLAANSRHCRFALNCSDSSSP